MTFTQKQARKIGNKLRVDWNKTDLENFRVGLGVEYSEHHEALKNSKTRTGEIVLDHLKENSHYYKPETDPSKSPAIQKMVECAEDHNIKVKFVPPTDKHLLGDYDGMNEEAAKEFGIKDYPKRVIKVDRTSPNCRKRKTLHHELIERGKMQHGERYAEAHVYSTAHENDAFQPKEAMFE